MSDENGQNEFVQCDGGPTEDGAADGEPDQGRRSFLKGIGAAVTAGMPSR